MIAVKENFPQLTPEEYFVWSEQQQLRYEYIDGEVYAMTGGTLNHSQIAINLSIAIGTHLRGSGCRVLNSDARVNIHESNDYVYPDLTVTCDRRDRNSTKFVSHPCLIAEVLSPNTEAYDRGDKFFMYRRSPTLQDYVLVRTDRVAIDLFSKDDQGKWDIINYQSGDLVELKSINFTFPIAEVFEGIIFEDNS
jgi:Uma2 family endonuclease